MTNGTVYPIAEHAHTIAGVPGRMSAIHAPQIVRGRLVHRSQKWQSEGREIAGFGAGGRIYVELRFDDECGNAHQTFAITASVYTNESRRRLDVQACGRLHDEIAAVFPELAHLIKWHCVSTDGPMHYVANATYLAGNRDHYGREAGTPSAWERFVYFDDSAVGHKIKPALETFIKSRAGTGDFQVATIAHDGAPGSYAFKPKFTLLGYGEKWHECPFDSEAVAREWCDGLNRGNYRFDRIATEFSEGKPRDLDGARRVAVWPEATDDELSAPKNELESALLARLPALIESFKADMTSCGFLWEPVQPSGV